MKALVKSRAATGLDLKKVPNPKMRRSEVLIRVKSTGICGTDLHIYKWDAWASSTIPLPLVIGHEFVGEVIDAGSDVDFIAVGDRVSGEGHIVCGRCRNCLAGRRHFCRDTRGVGVNYPGAFAELLVLPATNVWKLAPEVSSDVAAILDPFGNATHTAMAFPLLGEDVLITGAGPIGCMAAAIAKHSGARHVVVTDVNPHRLELAKKLGATRVVDVTRENLKEVQVDLGMREGFDVGMEMSGNEAAFNEMISNMRTAGQIALLGIPEKRTMIDWNKVIFGSLTIKGIYGRKMYDTWYQMTSMIQSGLNIEPVITHRYHYTDFEKGFAAMSEGLCGKVILNWAE
jgi:threonine 3-dehydrogenase